MNVLRMMLLTLLAVLPTVLDAALSVGRGAVKSRYSGPACLSGITYAGGTTYYVIADNGTDCGLDCGNGRRPNGQPLTEAEYAAYGRRIAALGFIRKDEASQTLGI